MSVTLGVPLPAMKSSDPFSKRDRDPARRPLPKSNAAQKKDARHDLSADRDDTGRLIHQRPRLGKELSRFRSSTLMPSSSSTRSAVSWIATIWSSEKTVCGRTDCAGGDSAPCGWEHRSVRRAAASAYGASRGRYVIHRSASPAMRSA